MSSLTRGVRLTSPLFSAKGLMISSLSLAISAISMGAHAQKEPAMVEEVVVTGIRSSLQSALNEKQNASSLVEVIMAEDIGKLPDQNLAEVLENVTGIQITRQAGVGTGVQIRGTNANRTEINGVSTVGSGAGRSGIDFEDISASIIAGVEVIKAPEAKTIEGSVGGTINLRTIRPLDLEDTLVAGRIQGEDSSLSPDGSWQPRYSGTFGTNWSTDYGDMGAVISASYAEQNVTAFRPRVDRDNFVAAGGNPSAPTFDHLPAQFFVQDYDNYVTENTNFAGTFEWAPNNDVKLYFDAIYNDSERQQESSRVQASGLSNLRFAADITEFETVNFGSLKGRNGSQNLGSIQAAVKGVIPAQTASPWDPNLRLSGDTNSRYSESEIYRLGGEWHINDKFSARVEVATSQNDTTTPSFNTTLNFLNPNAPFGTPNENATPFEFDLTGGSLTFGIAEGEANAPTTAQLLDPANYLLESVNQGNNLAENSEDAFRVDFTYLLDWEGITAIDFGYRYSETNSLRDEVGSNFGLSTITQAPRGNLFAELLAPGPDNFDDADGRDLFFPDFLIFNPNRVISDPNGVIATLNAALLAHNPGGNTISTPTSSVASFFDITEETNALYAQANFEFGAIRGNLGFRYVESEVNSKGFATLNGVSSPTQTSSDYSFVLPRFNLAVDISEDLILRMGWGRDIRRPDFDDLSTAFTFSTSPNPSVDLGNPNLEPEEVESFDFSAEWYFAPGSLVSVGYFHKERTGLHLRREQDVEQDPVTGYRDITPPCEGGGIFNPIADPNVFAPPGTPPGVCVPTSQTVNGEGETIQKGWELAFQYDLADFEDKLGWASGFGIIANYTIQEFSGSEEFYNATTRAQQVFASLGATNTVTFKQPLLDLSENAYNFTLYYEKYGISSRIRYTWREAYRSEDFGSTSSYPWGFPVVQEDRGQLNASINYDIGENFNVGLEVVNITEEEVEQSCVNEGSLLCFQGFTDRRITLGVSYRM